MAVACFAGYSSYVIFRNVINKYRRKPQTTPFHRIGADNILSRPTAFAFNPSRSVQIQALTSLEPEADESQIELKNNTLAPPFCDSSELSVIGVRSDINVWKNDILPHVPSDNLNYAQKVTDFESRKLSFESDVHSYTLEGRECVSVTTFLNQFFPGFDADATLDKYYEGWQTSRKRPEYVGISREEIKTLWKTKSQEAASRGTAMHAEIQAFFAAQAPTDLTHVISLCQSDEYSRLVRSVAAVERCMVDSNLLLAGTADMLTLTEDGNLMIVDWKRTEKPVNARGNTFGETGWGPLRGIPANNFHKFAIQMNLYRHLAEIEFAPLKVSEMWVVIIHPDNADFQAVQLPHLPKNIEALLYERKKQVAQKYGSL
mmetsp:Transcript_18929/g.26211  ORF Transcript_18929/g.26211 Transcript_18929/m.26211 type:complete len:373 (-) Transcript_18929:291-1409(-)|eukprot:CAMPEP_0196588304 /NCGR_PEP_ID=MMETSP1081-20130531/60198_1 /TAXON_ID=36882 /ORGANISM="Pyramimonas amylifera, Strain CCMP720" /LENGTH=372 /DNA_ID=CAMNT_0041910773 /DNA_START=68 /DNA_END=1186 /DNA_ORIENTATION=-